MIAHERKDAQSGLFNASKNSLTGLLDEPFTVIPNHFLDHIAPELTPTELRVMLYIYRHTLGYQKLADAISYDQFMNGITTHDGRRLDNGAKVSRRALVTALASLERKGLINRYHQGYAPAVIEIRTGTSAGREASAEPEPTGQQATDQAGPAPADRPAPAPETEPEPTGQPDQVQTLHPQPAGRTSNRVQNFHPTKQTRNQNKSRATAEASSLIVGEVPGITEREAEKIASTAFKNGRDLEYLTRLIRYVMTTPTISIPAAVLTALVKNNQDRTGQPVKGRTNQPRNHQTRPGRQETAARPAGGIDFTKYQPGGKYGFLVS